MSLARLTNHAKDAVLQTVSVWFLNHFQLKKLGRMTSLKLDSEKGEITLVLDLHGESAPIELTILYRVLASDRIEISEVRSSREWLATLANEMVPADKKQIRVPPMITAALSKLVR